MTWIHKYKRTLKHKRKLRTRLNSSSHYFTNVLLHSLIKSGLKHKAFKAFCKAVYNIKINRYNNNIFYNSTLDLFADVFNKLDSKLYLKNQHIGKTKYVIPLISTRSSISLARRWFLKSMFSRHDRTLYLKLSAEVSDVLSNMSASIKEKFKYYKLAFKSKINFRLLKFVTMNV